MRSQNSSQPLLELALDRRPLTVTANTPLADVLFILGKAQSSCVLPALELSLNTVLKQQSRAGVVWVVDGHHLLGQFTEADALKAIAAGQGAASTPIAENMTAPEVIFTLDDTQSDDQAIFAALAQIREHHLSHLPVLDTRARFVGAMTPEGMRGALRVDELLKAASLDQVAPAPPQWAPCTESVLSLTDRLAAHPEVDSLLLCADPDHDRTPLGMVLRRDILQLHMMGLDLSEIAGQVVMNRRVLQFPASESALVAYWKMQQQAVQRFVVTDAAGEWLGTVSPTTFLYGLDLGQIQQTHQNIERSVEQFAYSHATLAASTEPSAADDPEYLQEQLACSQLLAAMALHIRESLDLSTILQTAVDEVRQFLQSNRVLIYRFNPDMSGTVVVESLMGDWRPALNSTVNDTCFGQNYAGAYVAGRNLVVDDVYNAGLSQCHIDILTLFDVRASLVVPILERDHLWGLLCAYHCAEPRHWRSFEVDLLNQLATHIAIAIQQSELYQQAQTEIQERQQAEEQLKASLREKETLLKEIHHRVKNNLQIISSVLRLQSDYVKDDKVMALFNDSQNRIRSMALIHEKLYKSRDLLHIHMDDYIHDLVASILPSYGAYARNIDIDINASQVWLNIDTAIPCGLIINELVSNALKHAFPTQPQQQNAITIQVLPIESRQFRLTVSDNGVGFPPELDFRNTESLGLELVCVFTEQLEGTIELVSNGGTSFSVTFVEVSDSEGDR